MATYDPIRDNLSAASNSIAIPPPALGTAPSPSFISDDAITVPAGGFSTLYAFGDSLTDAGNVSLLTANQVPTRSIYSDGRFSNGNVWVQDLAANLHIQAVKPSVSGGTDYAYGGAQTGGTSVHAANPTDLPAQLALFEARVPHPSATALYTVWAGSNDVLDIANSAQTPAQQAASVTQAVANEVKFIDGLIAHGAQNLVVMNVPDLGVTPYENARPASDAASSALAKAYNAQLGTELQQIVASGAASINYVNTFGLLDLAVADPQAFGLTDVTKPVWTGDLAGRNGTLAATGSAQGGYLFFDSLHPTATGHSLLAQGVTEGFTGTV